MKTSLLFLLFTVTSIAWGQDIRRPPTANQCRADIAVWKARSKANITALSFKTLFQRSNYLSECSRVFRDTQDRDGSEWAHTIWGTYEHRALQRTLNFIERKHLDGQFLDEDAKGVR